MKYKLWMIAVVALMASAGLAATRNSVEQTTPVRQESLQVVQARPFADQSVSAESQAELKAMEFVDRLTDLGYQKFDLDEQTIQLTQAISDLRCQLEQNRLTLECVKASQKQIQRSIKDIEREKDIFYKKDYQRKEMGR